MLGLLDLGLVDWKYWDTDWNAKPSALRCSWTSDQRPHRIGVWAIDPHQLVIVECLDSFAWVWIHLLGVDGVHLLVEADTVEADENSYRNACDDRYWLKRYERSVWVTAAWCHQNNGSRTLGYGPLDFLERRAFEGSVRSVTVHYMRTWVRAGYEVKEKHHEGSPCKGKLDGISLTPELCEPHTGSALAPDVDYLFGFDRKLIINVLPLTSSEVVFEGVPWHFRTIAIWVVC